jgi:hypothetical protein
VVIRPSLLISLVLGASSAFAQFELDLSGGAPAKKADVKPGPKPKKPSKDEKVVAPPPKAEAIEFDLSSTADVKPVLLLPPIVRVTQSQGGFSGFDTKKTFERFDYAAHKRFVASLQKLLGAKVMAAEATQAALAKEGVTIAMVRTPSGIAKLAASAQVGFVVQLEFSKTQALVATVNDAEGSPKGEPYSVSNAASLTQKNADELASILGKGLIDLSKEKPAGPPVVEAPLPPPEEDVNDSPPELVAEVPQAFEPDPNKTRAVVAVGVGAVTRSLTVGGSAAAQLAELRNNGVAGVGVYVQLQPLQFIPSLAGKRFSDFEVEVNFRRAFVRATGIEGSSQGTSCSMTDDDLQLRGTYRFKVAESAFAPWVGVGAGWSQERTLFNDCTLPLVSATYGGFDAQLRIRQPLFRNVLALDLAFGPRFLRAGSETSTAVSLSGEAWLEAKPVSVLFVRGGARGSRLSAELPSVSLTETRFFFALEAGAYF